SPLFMSHGLYGSHDAGAHMILIEGNDNNGVLWDTFHGAGGNGSTVFRSYLSGREPADSNNGTNPLAMWANNRANNTVGNVLGASGYHDTYEFTSGGSNEATSIFHLGCAAWAGCASYQGVVADSVVKSSLLRWGNYDIVTGTRFNASEIPTSAI